MLDLVVGHEFIKAALLAVCLCFAQFEIGFEAGQIADRRIQPYVKVLSRRVGNFDAKVGRVARNIPIIDFLAAGLGVIGQPFGKLVDDFRLQRRFLRPLLQELHALLVRQLEEKVLGLFHHRLGTGNRRIGVLQVGRCVDRPAHFARIAVLILRATFRAFAFDVAVRQKHFLDRIEKLLDLARRDEFARFELFVNFVRERNVLWRMRGVPVVVTHQEVIPVGDMLRADTGDQLLGGNAFLLGAQHDRRTMRIPRTDKMHFMAVHALKSHPDIAEELIDDVADV